jgi:competence protein ComEA
MNSIRKWIRDIFGFSGTEINGFLILLPITLALVFSEPLFHAWTAGKPAEHSEDAKILDSLVAVWERDQDKPAFDTVQQVLFFFDPNTAAVPELRRLGFSERSSKRIAAYRLKGGVFRQKSDLMKIYGLDSTLYKQLYAYIRLPSSRLILAESGETPARTKPKREAKTHQSENFDLNTADTTRLKTIYGIGSRLAARIVKFRDGLGGFIHSNQLYEVYGLDSLVVDRLRKVSFIGSDFTPQKIDINAADEEQLAGHPYIRYKFARLLVSYRYQHGDFQQVSDIKKLSAMNPQQVERILPYIKVND